MVKHARRLQEPGTAVPRTLRSRQTLGQGSVGPNQRIQPASPMRLNWEVPVPTRQVCWQRRTFRFSRSRIVAQSTHLIQPTFCHQHHHHPSPITLPCMVEQPASTPPCGFALRISNGALLELLSLGSAALQDGCPTPRRTRGRGKGENPTTPRRDCSPHRRQHSRKEAHGREFTCIAERVLPITRYAFSGAQSLGTKPF